MLTKEGSGHVAAYREWLQKRKTPSTIKQYVGIVRRVLEALEAAGMASSPAEIGEAEIWYLMDAWAHLKTSNRLRQINVVNMWLQRMGKNFVVESMELPRCTPEKTPGAGWLDVDVAVTILSHCETVEERYAIVCMLYHGFRKIEVERSLHTDFDFRTRQILIWGKGPLGGKKRWVPFHPLAREVLAECMRDRETKIRAATAEYAAKNKPLAVPANQFLYHYPMRGLGYYKHTAIENMVAAVSERAGVYFSCHTLRKTFARMSWLAGVKLEVISEFLGHSNDRTTREYLGLNMDDMAEGMDRLGAFMGSQNPCG